MLKVGDRIRCAIGKRSIQAYGRSHYNLREDFWGVSFTGTVRSVSRNGNPLVYVSGTRGGLYKFAIGDFDEGEVINWLNFPFAVYRELKRERNPQKLDDKLVSAMQKWLSPRLPRYTALVAYSQRGGIEAEARACHYLVKRGVDGIVTYPNVPSVPGPGTAMLHLRGNGLSKENIDRLFASDHEDDKAFIRYIQFLVTDPVFAGTHKNTDARDALTRGVISNVDAGQARAMTLLIALRVPYEAFFRIRVWDALVKAGVSPIASAVLMTLVQPGSSRDKFYIQAYDHGHSPFAGGIMTASDLRRMEEGVYPKEVKKLRTGYEKVNDYWCGREGKYFIEQLQEVIGLPVKRKCPFTGVEDLVAPNVEFSLRETAAIIAKRYKEVM